LHLLEWLRIWQQEQWSLHADCARSQIIDLVKIEGMLSENRCMTRSIVREALIRFGYAPQECDHYFPLSHLNLIAGKTKARLRRLHAADTGGLFPRVLFSTPTLLRSRRPIA
jgi:hypothetical protein